MTWKACQRQVKSSSTRRTLYLGLLWVLGGCTSTHYYDGPARSPAELAQVYVSTYDAMSTRVTSIDGKADSFAYKKIVFLQPGEHVLQLETSDYVDIDDTNWAKFKGHFNLRFNTKPGKAYTFQSNETVKNRLRASNQLCVYEEDQNDPNKRIIGMSDYRRPSRDALQLACSKMDLQVTH